MPRNQAVSHANIAPLVKIGTMLQEIASFVDNVAGSDIDLKGAGFQRTVKSVANTSRHANATGVTMLINARKARGSLFPNNWFSDPAWDILLYLYKARLEGNCLTVGDISAGSAIRPTTTIRWIDIIESFDLITRRRCEIDSRRVFIELSTTGYESMNRYFSQITASNAALTSTII